jgi:hypothetical protein
VLAASAARRTRLLACGAALAALLVAPSVWAADTLGHAASGTFPAGGPASAQEAAPGAISGRGSGRGLPPRAGRGGLFGGPPPLAARGAQAPPAGGAPGLGPAHFAPPAGAGSDGFGGPFAGDRSLTAVLSYVKRHGGGTIAVSSQSSAAAAIVAQHASVAGIGGFSGRESEVSLAWLAHEVRSGKIRWVLGEQTGGPGGGMRLPGDTRAGSRAALAAVASACRAVMLPASATATAGRSGASGGAATTTLYDCQGRAQQLSR